VPLDGASVVALLRAPRRRRRLRAGIRAASRNADDEWRGHLRQILKTYAARETVRRLDFRVMPIDQAL